MTAQNPIWPIFVVSLTDATARRAAISTALGDRSLAFQFIDAVDGRSGLPPEYEEFVDRKKTVDTLGHSLTDGEYACALSHMSIYRRILEAGLPGALVLEDDAILTSLFDEFLAAEGWMAADLVQLDHFVGDVWRGERPFRLSERLILRKAARNASLTTGYSISSRGADFLLNMGLPLCGPADWPADTTEIGAMLALPRVVDHPPVGGANSTLEADRILARSEIRTGPRALRFFRRSYWQRWWFKRRTRRVS